MKKVLLIIFISTWLAACNKKQQELTIEMEKMSAIVADMHVAEEMLGKFRESDKDSARNLYLQEIALIHKVDTNTIFSNLEIMQNNPRIGIKVYTDTYEILNKVTDEVNEKK